MDGSAPHSTEPAALDLARRLIRCASVTPAEGGALDLLQAELTGLGFTCHRLRFEEDGTEAVDNLYARLGDAAPHFCFAGHTDVVPPGTLTDWRDDPFAAEVREGHLWGRGAADMKGAIAAFVTALRQYLTERGAPAGSVSLLITGDEEGPAINGTKKVLDWLKVRGERIDACLVGEPTNPETLGEMIKIGRRGSLNAKLTVTGTQGHVAYPHLADNPLPRLVRLLGTLDGWVLDRGTAHFQPSNLELTSIDTGNAASNVIPALATARLNIRFNDLHSGAALERDLRARLDTAGEPYTLEVRVSGEAFLTPPGPFVDLVKQAVAATTGHEPELSTSGGTSDARFIAAYAPVVEFGAIGRSMHKVDENLALSDLDGLTAIYRAVLGAYFGAAEAA